MDVCKSLIRVPEECVPEVFEKLLTEGRLDEYRRLEVRCYVRAEYVNQLVTCISEALERLAEVVESLRRRWGIG